MNFLGTAAARLSWIRCLNRNSLRVAHFSSTVRLRDATQEPPKDKVDYNKSSFHDPARPLATNYPLVSANELASGTSPPFSVQMLVRDYIENSLYNPNYGYFSSKATIFQGQTDPIDFSSLKSSEEFNRKIADRYAKYDKSAQLWHTPTELFSPWYGQAVARCLVSEYLLKYFPYEDFNIYEIGAGNGTLAMDILNHLQTDYPEVYERTRYTIIEISSALASLQTRRLKDAHSCVEVRNESIFRWNTRQPAPCFFVAMEVVDNFAHDLVRYDLTNDLEPYQGIVAVDDTGDFDTYYTKVSDPLILDFLELRRRLGQQPPVPRRFQISAFRKIYSNIPFAANLSGEDYIPTRLLTLLRTLRNHFPRHRLLLSDFSSLPDTIPGYNAPVVQIRHQNRTIPCRTLTVHPGSFDIFFPTNFEYLRDMYEYILSQPHSASGVFPSRSTPLSPGGLSLSLGEDFFSSRRSPNRRHAQDGVTSASGLPVGERKSNVFTHAEFLETYADVSQTRLQNGENPMLEYYQNAKFLF